MQCSTGATASPALCCGGGVRFFLNENVQEYYSYVAARGGWRTSADHELESRPIGLMRCGHFFLLCAATFPLGQSKHTQCSAAAPGPLIQSSVLVRCACVACSCRPAVQPLNLKQLNQAGWPSLPATCTHYLHNDRCSEPSSVVCPWHPYPYVFHPPDMHGRGGSSAWGTNCRFKGTLVL